MGLKFGRRDRDIYDTFSRAADDLRDYGLRRDLGEAYKADQEVVPGTPSEGEDAYTPVQYRLGNASSDTKFTPEQIQQFRFSRLRDVYAKAGMPEKALGMETSAAGLRRDARAEKRELRQDQRDAMIDQINADPIYNDVQAFTQKFVQRYNANEGRLGQGEHANLTATASLTPDGSAVVNFYDRTGGGDFAGVPSRVFTPEEIRRGMMNDRLAALAAADPRAYLKLALDQGVKQEEIDIKRGTLVETGRHYRATEANQGLAAQAAWAHYMPGGSAETVANIQAKVLRDRAGMNADRGSPAARAQVVRDQVEAYATLLQESGQVKDPKEARARAWGIVLKDPAVNPRNQRPDIPDAALQKFAGWLADNPEPDPKAISRHAAWQRGVAGWERIYPGISGVGSGPSLIDRLDARLRLPGSPDDPNAGAWQQLGEYDAGQGFDTPPPTLLERVRTLGRPPEWDVSPRAKQRGLGARHTDVQ